VEPNHYSIFNPPLRKVEPKWSQSRAKVEPKWSQSRAKVEPKWSQSGAKVEPKWSQNSHPPLEPNGASLKVE